MQLQVHFKSRVADERAVGSWTVRQPFQGIYLWRDPHGQLYLVDHTGTHPVTRPGHPAGPARGFDPATELVETDIVVHADFDDAG